METTTTEEESSEKPKPKITNEKTAKSIAHHHQVGAKAIDNTNYILPQHSDDVDSDEKVQIYLKTLPPSITTIADFQASDDYDSDFDDDDTETEENDEPEKLTMPLNAWPSPVLSTRYKPTAPPPLLTTTTTTNVYPNLEEFKEPLYDEVAPDMLSATRPAPPPPPPPPPQSPTQTQQPVLETINEMDTEEEAASSSSSPPVKTTLAQKARQGIANRFGRNKR